MAKLVALLLLVFTNNVKSEELSVPEYLQSISVKVVVGDGSGSGIAFTRKDANGKNITFIWTAAHIFTHHDVDMFSLIFGHPNTNVISTTIPTEYADIRQDIFDKDGNAIGYTNKTSKLFKFSDDESGQDLAILKVNGPFFNTSSVIFDLSGKLPKVGQPIYSMGSPYGLSATFSSGLFSFVGRNVDGLIFDQTSCVVFPGSSGGGVFSINGKYEGMSNIMKTAGVNFVVPIRRMIQWAKDEHIEWALDPNIPMPSDKEIKKINMWDTVLTKKLEYKE